MSPLGIDTLSLLGVELRHRRSQTAMKDGRVIIRLPARLERGLRIAATKQNTSAQTLLVEGLLHKSNIETWRVVRGTRLVEEVDKIFAHFGLEAVCDTVPVVVNGINERRYLMNTMDYKMVSQ